jgi:hypothetical protein
LEARVPVGFPSLFPCLPCPTVPGYPVFFGENISISGANVTINGGLQSWNDLTITGEGAKVCGLMAETIEISGANATVKPCA